jgi:hypothetical protein
MNTPSSGATGPQIAHDKIDHFRALGAFGKPVYQSHVQLRSMLRAKRGERAANYFAKPTYDPELGELRWTAEVSGPVRGWHEMSEQEQVDRALDLEVVHSQLKSYAQDLRQQPGGDSGGAASFASLLEQSLRVPQSGNYLYFVGDQPVIAFWGFEDRGGSSVDPGVQAPSYPASAVVPKVVASTGVLAGTETRKRPWWTWLLWVLLALLLLALLLLLPRACTPDGGLDLKRILPETNLPAAVEPPAPEASAPGVHLGPDDQTTPLTPGAPPADQAQGATQGLQGPEDRLDGGGTLPPDPTPPDPTPPEASDLNPLTPPALPPDAKTESGTDPKAPPDAKLEPDQARPPTEPQQMRMPDDQKSAEKLDFLEGDWKAGEGLVDKVSRQPLDMSFKFGKDGQGEVTVRRPDGTVCSGPVNGRMEGRKLSIQGKQQVPCSNGGQYGAPRIECEKDRNGQTQCLGVNPDGSKYFMGIERR